MRACRSSNSIITVFVIALSSMGCRGTTPQRQPLVLTEDPAVRVGSIQAPLQRLAITKPLNQQSASAQQTREVSKYPSEPAKNATAESSGKNSVKVLRQDAELPSKTRLVPSAGSVKQVAYTEPVAQKQAFEKQSANEVRSPSNRKPSRSEAVEALLAANRATSRARRRSDVDQAPSAKSTVAKTTARPKPRAAKTDATNFALPPRESKAVTAKDGQLATKSRRTEKPKTRSSRERLDSSKKSNESQVAKSTKPPAKFATNGKTVRFSDLPMEVKRRAMDRLIANLAKQAVPTDQPLSLKQKLTESMKQLPKLPPLGSSNTDVPPTRIASKRTGKPQHANVAATTKPIEKPAKKPIKKSNPPPSSNEMIAVAVEPVDAPIAAPVNFPVASPAAEQIAMAAPAPPNVIQPPAKQASGFVLPPIQAISQVIPKQDDANFKMVMPVDPSAQWSMPANDQALSAIANSDLRYASAEPTAAAEDSSASLGELSLSALSQELETLPDEFSRDAFRVSRVGLPEPNDYFANASTAVQQVSSQQSLIDKQRILDQRNATELAIESIQKSKPNEGQETQDTRLQAFSMPSIAMTTSAKSSPDLPDFTNSAPLPKSQSVMVRAPEISKPTPQSMSDRELYNMLLARLNDPSKAETPAEQSRRQIMARHLMVLAGDRDAAIKEMQGLSEQEQQFLRNQLEGLHAMVDPKGHPVAGRRFSQALPNLRKATQHLSAAADSLEVRGLEFCTEIEAYGQVKPFPTRQFAAGQAVILYCEVDRFTARKTEAGYETHLKGSYDVLTETGEKVLTQLLPADKQLSRNFLRDYFVAYQMNLPAKLTAGKYRLQLTMEDIAGEKYGQTEIDFEIVTPAN